jgi:hypothetical protein
MTFHAWFHETAGYAGVIAALVAGIFTWRNTARLNRQSRESADFQGAVDRELARLGAKLDHERLVHGAQWNAEFSAYQSVWAAFVPVRGTAQKLTTRDEDLVKLGIVDGDVSPDSAISSLTVLLERYAKELSACMVAINANAPFYDGAIRTLANQTHELAYSIFDIHAGLLVQLKKQLASSRWKTPVPPEGSEATWKAFVAGVDQIERAIRRRMEEVRVLP